MVSFSLATRRVAPGRHRAHPDQPLRPPLPPRAPPPPTSPPAPPAPLRPPRPPPAMASFTLAAARPTAARPAAGPARAGARPVVAAARPARRVLARAEPKVGPAQGVGEAREVGEGAPGLTVCGVGTQDVETAISEAKQTCEEGTTGECAAAWDEVRLCCQSMRLC